MPRCARKAQEPSVAFQYLFMSSPFGKPSTTEECPQRASCPATPVWKEEHTEILAAEKRTHLAQDHVPSLERSQAVSDALDTVGSSPTNLSERSHDGDLALRGSTNCSEKRTVQPMSRRFSEQRGLEEMYALAKKCCFSHVFFPPLSLSSGLRLRSGLVQAVLIARRTCETRPGET